MRSLLVFGRTTLSGTHTLQVQVPSSCQLIAPSFASYSTELEKGGRTIRRNFPLLSRRRLLQGEVLSLLLSTYFLYPESTHTVTSTLAFRNFD